MMITVLYELIISLVLVVVNTVEHYSVLHKLLNSYFFLFCFL